MSSSVEPRVNDQGYLFQTKRDSLGRLASALRESAGDGVQLGCGGAQLNKSPEIFPHEELWGGDDP